MDNMEPIGSIETFRTVRFVQSPKIQFNVKECVSRGEFNTFRGLDIVNSPIGMTYFAYEGHILELF
jgi:hypothetical protein